MRTVVKAMFLSTKYGLIRAMVNKTTFLTNVIFMILNDASFIIQWLVLFSINDNIGGYGLKDIYLLWGMAGLTYGVAHFFFEKAFDLANVIMEGKMDAYLVIPKSPLLMVITSEVEPSAIGDIIYGIITVFLYGFSFKTLFLMLLFGILGGLILVSTAVIAGSTAFWFGRSDSVADIYNRISVHFATYPDGIFKGIVRVLFFTVVPLGFVSYMPVWVVREFNFGYLLIIIMVTILFCSLSALIFRIGLKKYSSSNLMSARI